MMNSRKLDLNQPATKKDILLAKQDINNLRLSTREDIKSAIQASETRTDTKMEALERRIDDKAKLYRDQVLTKIDSFLGKFETLQQELIISNHHMSKLFAKSENHEKRMKHIEKLQKVKKVVVKN